MFSNSSPLSAIHNAADLPTIFSGRAFLYADSQFRSVIKDSVAAIASLMFSRRSRFKRSLLRPFARSECKKPAAAGILLLHSINLSRAA